MLAALAGGVGAARFLRGLVGVTDPSELVVVVNTADDDVFHGLHVSPDLDSVVYTLAGAAEPTRGWGLAGETFRCLEGLERYGNPTWFRLGDRDLATHLYRTERLRAGAPLSAVTAEVARAWGLQPRIVPMTDDRVSTVVTVRGPDGPVDLAMQEWFVRERAEPPVVAVRFDGAAAARPAPGVLEAIEAAGTIVVCPSNPVISIGPILAVPGVREALARRREHVVAVSPIIAGAPVKGPADRLMAPLGIEVSCVGVASAYRDICGALVLDAADRHRASEVESLGLHAVVAETLMTDDRVAATLARDTLAAVA
ncbi:MAG: 2-phospho-L-lactate transferase [Acidimicrobiia bacterium]|nr:2-phospho-L-lactate transferase [Acidimicrobiia bacterium]MCL4292904.1 2-phospho-L-lactate transferase [Acidimicrobiia bacterium]